MERLDAAHGLLGGRVFIFAVQAVEDLEVDADADSPARQYIGYLIIVERTAAHGNHLRKEVGALGLHALYGQIALYADLRQQRIADLRHLLIVVYTLDIVEHEHHAYRRALRRAVLAQRIGQSILQRCHLQPRIGQLALGLGQLKFDIELLAARNHALLLQGLGIAQVRLDASTHLLAHVDHLHGQRKPEVAFDELRDQRIARALARQRGTLLIEPCGTVGRIDLSAEEYRHRNLAADEAEAAVLNRILPVGTEYRRQLALQRRSQLGRNQACGHAAGYDIRSHTADGIARRIEIDS